MTTIKKQLQTTNYSNKKDRSGGMQSLEVFEIMNFAPKSKIQYMPVMVTS